MNEQTRAGTSGPITERYKLAAMPLGIPPLAAGGSGYYSLPVPGLGAPAGAIVSGRRGSTILPIQVFARPDSPALDVVTLHVTNPGPDPVDLSGAEFAVQGFGY